MTSENTDSVAVGTIKAHGIAIGDAFNFHGMATGDAIPTTEATRVKFAGKVGNKYMLVSVMGDQIMTWEFGPSAKIYADTSVAHYVTTEARTLNNGDTVYIGECEHGWITGFHTTEDDARAVAVGHGEVSRPLYAAPVVVEVSPADITGAEVETARVAIRDNGRVFVAEAHNFGGLAAFDILVESGTHILVNDGDMSRYIRTPRTADRKVITDGLAVWDYNLDAGHVDLSTIDSDGWFYVNTVRGTRSLVNGERVTTVHPFTGRPAEAEVSMPPVTVDAPDTMTVPTVPVADGEDYCDDIPAPGEAEALQAEHDAAMDTWAAPLLAVLSPGLGAIADDLVEADARHAAALAAEVPTRAEDICPVCDFGKVGTVHTTPLGHLCAGNPVPVVEIHTGDGTVITEDDVKARVREAFGPSAGVSHVGSEVAEAEVWAGTDTMITYPLTRPNQTKMRRRARKSSRRARRGIKGGF